MKRPAVRTRIEDIRRMELIEAAHRVFIEHGLGGLTTERICREAGMSPGILSYYFKGKEEVLFGMVRYNNRLLMRDVVARLEASRTDWDRLVAIVEGNFPAVAFERNTANAWLSVCAAAAKNVRFARLQAIFYSRIRSNIMSILKPYLARDRIEDIVLTVGLLIDGLWLRKASDGAIPRDRAIRVVLASIEHHIDGPVRERMRTSLNGMPVAPQD